MKGHIFLVPDYGVGAFVHRPCGHAEKGLFRIVAPACHKTQHPAHPAVVVETLGGDYGKTSGPKNFFDAFKIFRAAVLPFFLFFVAAEQEKHRNLLVLFRYALSGRPLPPFTAKTTFAHIRYAISLP
jgi:hypothetical protein